MRWALSLVLVIAGVAVAVALWPDTPRVVERDDGALTALEVRIRELERRPEPPSRTVVTERLVSPTRAVSESETVLQEEESPEDLPLSDQALDVAKAEARIEREAERERMTALIEAESRDAEWANATELALRSSVADRAQEHARVSALECRTNYCRIELSHQDVEAQQAAMYGVSGSPGFRLPGRAHLEYDDEQVTTYIFLARHGDFFAEP